MSRGRRLLVAGSTAAVLLFLIFGITYLTRPAYAPVFTQLEFEDAAEITKYLQQANIPFQIGQQGTAVLVTKDKVPEIRMELAAEGLPRGGVVGLEIWDKTSLTETDFDRRIRLLRSLQGELTRTLQGIEAIDNARVHIVLPENTLFIEAQNPATASVFLVLKRGRGLNETQIRGITHLIASSVEGLKPEHVTIIDNNGTVLSDALSSSPDKIKSGQVLQQLEIERSYEYAVERSIQAMLERIFGVGRVVVRVKAELDFHYEELREKRSEPVIGSKGVVVSEEMRSETYQGTAAGGGVPGVASNIPGYAAIGDGAGEIEYEKEETTRNYELNVSEMYRVKAPGELQKMSVAVWIDGELAEEDRTQLAAMVSSAAGTRTERGDIVQIASMPFAPEAVVPASAVPGIPGLSDWRIWLLAVVLALLLILLVVWVRRRRSAAEEVEELPSIPTEEEEEFEGPERELSPEEEQRLRIRRQLERMAEDDPEELSRLLRAWMADD